MNDKNTQELENALGNTHVKNFDAFYKENTGRSFITKEESESLARLWMKIVFLGGGTAILLYCENTSGKNIGISVDDMSVNGFMLSPFFSTTVYDGKKSIDDITIFSSDLEENGTESIEEVELKFHIYDADTYSTITEGDPITFSVN